MIKPKYKVGDIVTIKKRTLSQSDYRHGFVTKMAELCGKQFTIRRVEESTPDANRIADDGYNYYLEGVSFIWVSSMFEDASEALSLETSIDNSLDAFIAKKKCPKLDFTL